VHCGQVAEIQVVRLQQQSLQVRLAWPVVGGSCGFALASCKQHHGIMCIEVISQAVHCPTDWLSSNTAGWVAA
jgi:hypothetical protein